MRTNCLATTLALLIALGSAGAVPAQNHSASTSAKPVSNVSTHAQSSPRWYSEFYSGLNESKRLRKWLFVLISTDWCPRCRELDANVLPLPAVQQFLTKNYVLVRLDGDRPYAKSLKERYKYKGVPTLMVFAPTGQLVAKMSGAPQDASSFISYVTRLTKGEQID